VRERRAPALPVDDSAFAEGRGCYTSVRIAGGRARFEARHLRRLARGARALALGEFDPAAARSALRDLARTAFPGGEGIVRLQLSRDATGRIQLVGIPRPLGADPPVWTAITAPLVHEGAILAGGHKLTNRLVHALASDAARRAGADEALLFDRAGRLVEAARSNVIVIGDDDRPRTPPLERGAVSGVARDVLMERIPEISERDVSANDLRRARAIVCTNAVRGVRPLARLDAGSPVGTDHPWVDRLRETLADAAKDPRA